MKTTIGKVRAWLKGARATAAGFVAALTMIAAPLCGSGVVISAIAAPTSAAANSGWCGDQTTLPCSPSAYETGYQAYAGFQLFATYLGVVPSGQPGIMYALYAGGNCFLPSQGNPCYVIYYCADGTEQADEPGGQCPSGPAVCTCNNAGDPVAGTPHPIDILSGNKRLTATDFANASGTLTLTRVHASAAQISASAWRASVATGPISAPVGLGNWLYDFQFELQLSSATPTAPVLLLTPAGAAPAFAQNTAVSGSLTLVPYAGTLPPNPQSDYILSIVGYTPIGGSLTAGWPTSLTAQSTTWTLQAPNDTIYTLTTYLDPNTSVYDTARPTKIQWRDGHSWTLSYGKKGVGELDTVTDNFGNQAGFTWQPSSANGAPLAIASVALGTASGGPSGYGLQYIYATVGGSQGGQNNPDTLTETDYLAPSGAAVPNCSAPLSGVTGVVLDCTFYKYNQYNNANCPYNVSGVYDAGETQRWGVTYDPNSCMATVSSVTGAAGAVRSYEVSYPSEPPTPCTPPATNCTFTRVVTNPLNKVSTYTYLNSATEGLQLTEIQNAASTYSPASTRHYYYGTSGFLSSITDENGFNEAISPRVCSYSTPLDFICGMPIHTTEAYGTSSARSTAYTWSNAALPLTITAPTSTTTLTYTSFGAVASKTVEDTTSFTTPYPTNGRTRVWTWTWNASDQLAAVHGPLWVSGGNIDTTAFTYNTTGYLETTTQYLNATTTATTKVTSWDWRGAPLSITDPNGVVTTYTYDIHGRPLTKTVNFGGTAPSEWQYAYDDVGDLTQLTLPVAQGVFSYTYDQGQRLITVMDIRNETKTFAYDNNDDPTSVTIAIGSNAPTYTHGATYDEWGRMIQSIGAASQTWSLAYDNLSNLLTVTDPVVGSNPANVRASAYDPLNRMIKQTDPSGAYVQYAYDPADNLDQLTDADNLVTNREVDGFGETIQEVSPDRGTLQYWYDLHGNVIEKLDADSVETQNAYDWANRLVSTTYTLNVPANPTPDPAETVTYIYDATAGGNDGIGRLTSVSDVSGSEAMTYDAQGRLTADAKVVKTGGYTTPYITTYAYDLNGQVIGIGYPSGDALTYARTYDGLVTGISFTPKGGLPETVASTVVHAPYGKVASLTYGNLLNLTRTYNQDYELIGVVTAPTTGAVLLNETFGWQADGRIGSVTDNLTPASRTAAYTYAATGRIASGSGPWGNLSWSFDANGNLTGIGTATKMTLGSGSNQVTTLAVSGTPTDTYTYLPGGELSGDTNTSAWVYSYNAARRMTEVTMGGAESAAYAYDWAGAQVYQQALGLNGAGTFQTAHLADLEGHVQADHNAVTGGLEDEYIWLDGTLVGLVTASGSTRNLYAETTGQNDEPQLLTSSAGATASSTALQPMGALVIFGTQTVSPNLRYPGQWVRAEAALEHLYHNGQRDYAPNLGRYTQADPLGINAGANPYAYVDGDPLNAIDPSGLVMPGPPLSNGNIFPLNSSKLDQDIFCFFYNFANPKIDLPYPEQTRFERDVRLPLIRANNWMWGPVLAPVAAPIAGPPIVSAGGAAVNALGTEAGLNSIQAVRTVWSLGQAFTAGQIDPTELEPLEEPIPVEQPVNSGQSTSSAGSSPAPGTQTGGSGSPPPWNVPPRN